MEHLFYVVAIFWIIYEWGFVSDIQEKMDKTNKLVLLHKEFKGKSYKEWSEEYKDMAIGVFFFQLPLYVWLFVGLFTFQWTVFLYFVFQMYILTGLPRKIFGLKSRILTACVWLNSFVGLLMGFFVIVNKYHFHINVWEVLKQYFNL